MNPPTRSELLVHWTGRDCKDPHLFIERLKSIYENGLYYTDSNFYNLHGVGGDAPSECKLPHLPSICFTELRLRHAHRFSKRYGTLGIVFQRAYLIKKGGANPVFYIHSGNSGIVNTHVVRLSNSSEINSENTTSNDQKYILSFCKPMSKPEQGDLVYFEEHEWRMVVFQSWETNGNFLPLEFRSCKRSPTERSFYFEHHEVQAIVFPDKETRRMAMKDPTMQRHFNDHAPQLIDLDLCHNV